MTVDHLRGIHGLLMCRTVRWAKAPKSEGLFSVRVSYSKLHHIMPCWISDPLFEYKSHLTAKSGAFVSSAHHKDVHFEALNRLAVIALV